jgi:mRNA interferase RelE/StbE
MTYELEFRRSALKEWNKLGATIRSQFAKKLRAALENTRIPSAKLSGENNLYKIKLRQAGYRLAYEVNDTTVTVTVIAVGKRENNQIYKTAMKQMSE